jgi:hypothetical protein
VELPKEEAKAFGGAGGGGGGMGGIDNMICIEDANAYDVLHVVDSPLETLDSA